MNHTPTPWHIETKKIHFADIYSLSGVWVAHCESAVADSVKDAAFIVRACNAHDDLVEALEMLMQTCQEEGHLIRLASYRQAESALKLARGE